MKDVLQKISEALKAKRAREVERLRTLRDLNDGSLTKYYLDRWTDHKLKEQVAAIRNSEPIVQHTREMSFQDEQDAKIKLNHNHESS